MAKEVQEKKCCSNKNWNTGNGAVYGMGFIGALIYFIQHATTFWEGVIGVFKAIFWPGFLIYRLLELLRF